MYTKLSSSQKMKKIIPENFSLLSPVSLTPLNNIHSRFSPRIFEKNRNDPKGILKGQGDSDLQKKTWSWKSRQPSLSADHQQGFTGHRYQVLHSAHHQQGCTGHCHQVLYSADHQQGCTGHRHQALLTITSTGHKQVLVQPYRTPEGLYSTS